MSDYPELRVLDPTTGNLVTASPTGRYRVDFAEPTDSDAVPELVDGAVPLTRGLTLGATLELGSIDVDEIRLLAAPDVVQRISPVYELDDIEFMPRPGSIYIRARGDERAQELVDEVVAQVNAGFDRPVEVRLVDRTIVEPAGLTDGVGLYEYAIVGGSKEPSYEIEVANLQTIFGEGEAVCIDVEHPLNLPTSSQPGACVAYDDYDANYIDYAQAMNQDVDLEHGRVAVLDSFFDLDHDALVFSSSGDVAFGVNTVGTLQCSVDQHGTSCAGVVGANGTAAEQADAVGEYQAAEILPVRVYEQGLDKWGEVALARGIFAAVAMGASVVSISIAASKVFSCILEDAVLYARANDVLVVAGAGNARTGHSHTPIDFPARYKSVVAVGAAEFSGSQLRRCVDIPALGGGIRWSSKFGVPDNERLGLDVVAAGHSVATTNLRSPNDGTTPLFWGQFLGTSASAPIVAGLAVRIRTAFRNASASEVRARLQCLAEQPDGFEWWEKRPTADGTERPYSKELGFGWIARYVPSLDCGDDAQEEGADVLLETMGEAAPADSGPAASAPAPQMDKRREIEPEGEDDMTDRDGSPIKDDDCTVVECVGLPTADEKGYPDVSVCARPLSVFLKALGDRRCCDLLFDFMKEPYRTARIAGVPYSAAVWLGSGDWAAVNQALAAENNLDQSAVGAIADSIGPIWVKAT